MAQALGLSDDDAVRLHLERFDVEPPLDFAVLEQRVATYLERLAASTNTGAFIDMGVAARIAAALTEVLRRGLWEVGSQQPALA